EYLSPSPWDKCVRGKGSLGYQAICATEPTEVTKLEWKLTFTHKVADAQTAQDIEQTVLKKFSGFQLASNGEVLQGVAELDVQLAIKEAAARA
ncbi:hypothetical protein, partial [Allosediminivita pacifica]